MMFLQPFASQQLLMQNLGNPVDFDSGGRYLAADKFSTPLFGEPSLSSYVEVTLKQANMIFNRIKEWELEGTCRINISEEPVTGGDSYYPEEYQVLTYEWHGESDLGSEADLLRDFPHRPGFYNYDVSLTPPWRGYSSEPADAFSGDPYKVDLITLVAGDTGSSGPGPYFDPSTANGFLRFQEWSKATSNSWDDAGGAISCDFQVFGAGWKSILTAGDPYPVKKPYQIMCVGDDESLVIVGLIGSASTSIIGSAGGFDYNFILRPIKFWNWEGKYNEDSGLPI